MEILLSLCEYVFLHLLSNYLHLQFSTQKEKLVSCRYTTVPMFCLRGKFPFSNNAELMHGKSCISNLFKLNTRFLGNESVHATILGYLKRSKICLKEKLFFFFVFYFSSKTFSICFFFFSFRHAMYSLYEKCITL